jgi:hypothetical protein
MINLQPGSLSNGNAQTSPLPGLALLRERVVEFGDVAAPVGLFAFGW